MIFAFCKGGLCRSEVGVALVRLLYILTMLVHVLMLVESSIGQNASCHTSVVFYF